MKRPAGFGRLAFVLLFTGCGPSDLHRPPALRLGQEACAHCRMIISDDRFASALETAEGETQKFDDLGCMILHESVGVRHETRYWVRDYGSDAWLDARDAVFIHSPRIASPMGYGFAAAPTIEHAAVPANDPASRTLRFDELWGFLTAAHTERPAATSIPRDP
jgi:copper chaperone NosL